MRKSNFQMSTFKMFSLWLLVVPAGMVYLYLNYRPVEVNWIYLLIFLLFTIVTLNFPISLNGKPLFLAMWITIPAFLLYGLFVETLLMQIAITTMLVKVSKDNTTRPYRFFMNSLILFILSVAAASVFSFVGGEVGSVEFGPIILAVFCYQLTHSFLMDFILRFYKNISGTKSSYLSKKIVFSKLAGFGILPFSLTVYFLLQFIGIGSFLLLGVPFFFVTLILRLYNNSEHFNSSLKNAGEIGHELSNKMTEKEVIDQFVVDVTKMLGNEYTFLFDYKDGWLELVRAYEYHRFEDVQFSPMLAGQGLAGTILKNNKPIIYPNRQEWESLSVGYTPDDMQSVICLPITRNQKVEAVLLVSSVKKNAFKDYQLMILDILCSYFAVSIEKARYVQETVKKSERCALTKLYNYRYMEERLEYEVREMNSGNTESLSVLMLDIDHFKKINDTYGHESGNDILFNLARVLEEALPNDATVARYGGEEFIYLLPGMTKIEAIQFAEKLRIKIRNTEFIIAQGLGEIPNLENVTITVSIGVSSAPEDTDDAKSLLRNADRSLYLWAKQAGRDRVASYVK
ncbi:sensor domain-containing diguanylate cyclase [Sporosarcina siberiensis]|uniref:Sensor domain-containing diguanylate cyclase n=1 Tax=Sporosarcina siberiensis TaxID=1365606 RepID=A0ABW4SFX6_9BACL